MTFGNSYQHPPKNQPHGKPFVIKIMELFKYNSRFQHIENNAGKYLYLCAMN